MKRSFGSSRGRMGGVGTVREVGRAVGGTVQGAFSTSPGNSNSNNNKGNNNSLISITSTSASTAAPVSSSYYLGGAAGSASSPSSPPLAWHSASCFFDSGDQLDWVHVLGGEEEEEEEATNGFCNRFVLGPVPSEDEVEEAVSILKHVTTPVSFLQVAEGEFSSASNWEVGDQFANYGLMHIVPSNASDLDWIEPSLVFHNPQSLESHGAELWVHEAFHLLHTEPLVQRLIFSLSTDKALWEAVLNNETVHEFRDSCIAEDDKLEGSGRSPGSTKGIVKLMLNKFIAKIVALAEKLRKSVQEALLLPCGTNKKEITGGAGGMVREKLISSLLLSVVVLVMVVLTRARRA